MTRFASVFFKKKRPIEAKRLRNPFSGSRLNVPTSYLNTGIIASRDAGKFCYVKLCKSFKFADLNEPLTHVVHLLTRFASLVMFVVYDAFCVMSTQNDAYCVIDFMIHFASL